MPKQSSSSRDMPFRGAVADGPADTTVIAGGVARHPYSPTQHAGPAQHHSFPRAGDGGRGGGLACSSTYTFKASPISSPVIGSPVRTPLQAGSGCGVQAGASSSPRTSISLPSGSGEPVRTASSASLAESFQQFAGTSPTEEYSFTHHIKDRFPFSADAHAATAIRG